MTAFEPLMLGCTIAILYESQMLKKGYSILQWMALAGIAVLALILWHDSDLHITNDWLLRVGYSVIDLVWAWLLAFLVLANQRPKFIAHFFQLKWIGWLGKYSYGIYIFHWIVLQLFIYRMEMMFGAKGLSLTLTYY